MLKLLLGLRLIDEKGHEVMSIMRPLLWPVKPTKGEKFFLSSKSNLCCEVGFIAHDPNADCIHVIFDTSRPDDLVKLLEQDIEWSDIKGISTDSIIWPKPETI